jgi:hypothetical protein
MSPEEQRKTIAEACGWERIPFNDGGHAGWMKDGKFVSTTSVPARYDLPDFLGDLNAMHGAMAICLPSRILKQGFIRHLHDIVYAKGKEHPEFGRFYTAENADDDSHFAGAPLLAEALLRTIGAIPEPLDLT